MVGLPPPVALITSRHAPVGKALDRVMPCPYFKRCTGICHPTIPKPTWWPASKAECRMQSGAPTGSYSAGWRSGSAPNLTPRSPAQGSAFRSDPGQAVSPLPPISQWLTKLQPAYTGFSPSHATALAGPTGRRQPPALASRDGGNNPPK